MKNKVKVMRNGLLLAGVMVVSMIFASSESLAAKATTGATAALKDTSYTLEEMLVYAVEDEYLAQAEYAAIIEKFGTQKPYSNIIKAEATHIKLLLPLLEANKVTVPKKDWNALIVVPKTITESHKAAVTAEKNNIAMYEKFLKQDLPADVKDVFERLLNASKKHLISFQRAVDGQIGTGNNAGRAKGKQGKGSGNCTGTGTGKGSGSGNRSGNRSGTGTCILN